MEVLTAGPDCEPPEEETAGEDDHHFADQHDRHDAHGVRGIAVPLQVPDLPKVTSTPVN
jgi:hypothetical protein